MNIDDDNNAIGPENIERINRNAGPVPRLFMILVAGWAAFAIVSIIRLVAPLFG